jgi:hypothetical protein
MLIKAPARCARAPVLPDRKLASLELDKLTVAFDELHNIWQLAISSGTGALGRQLNPFAPLRSCGVTEVWSGLADFTSRAARSCCNRTLFHWHFDWLDGQSARPIEGTNFRPRVAARITKMGLHSA